MNRELPKDIYSAEQVREMDRIAIEEYGIDGYELMQRAGRACLHSLLERWPEATHLRIYCGIGNNGGDGYVIARMAAEQGMVVEVVCPGPVERIQGDALKARLDWLPYAKACAEQSPEHVDVFVDAVFGTGLSRPPEGQWLHCIEVMNAAQAPVFAVDIPSGLDADTGLPAGVAVVADRTLTFIGLKQGLLTGCAADYTGKLCFDSLQLPDDVYACFTPIAERLQPELIMDHLPARLPSSHKGCFGHVLLIGGSEGMQGAIQMAALGSARSGAGLTTLLSQTGTVPALEIMSCQFADTQRQEQLLEQATALVVGPGLGADKPARSLFEKSLQQHKPVVMDAGALQLLAESNSPVCRENWILTPHPGEAARLLNISTAEVQQDRYSAVVAIQKKYGGVCVLKGFGTLIFDGSKLYVCNAGNPGMASGGMGDILAGIIGGLLAQGLALTEAVRVGVLVHACAGDLAAAEYGERGLLATDLLPFVHQLVNPARKE